MTAVDLQCLTGFQFFTELGGQHVRFNHSAAVAANLSAAVIVDLGTGSCWSFVPGGAPPIVLISVAVDSLRRHTNLVAPDAKGFFVVQMNRYVKAFRGQFEKLGDQFPAETNGALFEIVPDAEVAQHLKEGQVLVVANLIDVICSEALLAAGESLGGRGLLSHEKGLEGHHPGAGE